MLVEVNILLHECTRISIIYSPLRTCPSVTVAMYMSVDILKGDHVYL